MNKKTDKIIKKLPYGNCNFADMIERNFAYVDKTRYIELLENENNSYQYLLRPRRFGKSLFLSMMENYYDLNRKDKFMNLFSGLYIGRNPTPEQGTYAILKFDFSVVNTDSRELFYKSFSNVVQEGVCNYLERYKNILDRQIGEIRIIKEQQLGLDSLLSAYNAAESNNVKIFVIVDEYDNFANSLMMMNSAYQEEVMGDGIVRTFYKSLKSATATVVRRIFMTGVSPMMVNDLTSGFNMATNLSLLPYYNEMFGFTRDEVEWIMNETGVDRTLITVDMESFFNGYMFDNKGKDSVYNSQMILYLFQQILQRGEQPEQVVDPNLRTGYERLHSLAQNEDNRGRMLDIIRDGETANAIAEFFSVNQINIETYFISFLFYLGMLTCGGTAKGKTRLKIPNYSIQTLYWEYMGEYIHNITKKPIRDSKLEDTIYTMASEGDIAPYLDYFTRNILERLSNRDIQRFDEKYIKAAMLTSLFLNNYYFPVSESENTGGYSDIYLQRAPAITGVKYEYIFEIKYLKKENASKKEIESKFSEAAAQLEKYKKDARFINRSDIKFAAIVFWGKSGYSIREA